MRDFSLLSIAVAIGFCGGCSKAPEAPMVPSVPLVAQPVPVTQPSPEVVKPMGETPQPTAPVEQVPAASPTVKEPAAPKITKAESTSPGELKKLGLFFYFDEEPSFEIMAPPKSEYRCTPDGQSMSAYGPQFNLQIDYGSYDFKALADHLTGMGNVTIVEQQKDSLIIKKKVPDPDDSEKVMESHGVYLNRSVGNRDFRIYSLDADLNSKPCVYSLSDVQRMLRSGSQLELAQPLPTDPLALCKKLGIELSHRLYGETVDQKEIVRVDLPIARTTDSMLPLLAKIPSLIEVRTGMSLPPQPGKYDVKGSSWAVLSQLPQLKRLEFMGRDADDDAIAAISQLKGLTKLEIGNSTLRLESIKPLEKLANLEILVISAFSVTDAGFEQFPLLPKLKKLELYAQNSKAEEFTGTGLRSLQKLTELRELELDAGPCGEAGFQHIGQIASLVELSVSSENLTDAGLAQLKLLTNLEALKLGSKQITDAGVEHLSGLTKLKKLNLSSASVTDEGLPHLQTLVNLEDLDLGETKLTDAGLSRISPLTNLKELRLARTDVTSAGIESLLSFTKLESLSLHGTKITSANLDKLSTLKFLKYLYVGGAQPPLDDETLEKLKTALPKCSIITN